MFSKNKYLLILINLFIGLVQFGCFDKPNEFVAPVWDAEINIPITSKQFELRELVEKDSALLKAYDDPELLGLLYFGDIQPISSISINDDLKLDGIETGFSESLGQIKVKIPIPVASEIRVEDWTTEVTSGSFQIFPEQEGTVSIDVAGVESVESILADEGNLSLFIVNRLPVEIVLRGISIKNGIDGSVIAERSGSNPAQWLAIPPLSFDTVSFPVDGKVITNSLLYEGTIWSQGSNGEAVQIPEEAGTTILALFQDLVIGEATAALPVQDFGFSGEIKLDDSTKIREAVIEDGRGKITIDNNIDLNVAINVVFENLIDPDNQQYNFEIFLQKNEKNRVVDLPSLKGWRIVTLTPGVGTNHLSYSVYALTDSTGEISTITKNDSVLFNVNFDEILLEAVHGTLKPTSINLDESSFMLDYGNLNGNLSFEEINFEDASFILNMQSSSDMIIQIDGIISGYNGINTVTKNIENIIVPSDELAKIDISDLINGFSQVLPDSFSLSGSALLNPFYQPATVKRGDSLYGDIEFEIPLNFGIAAGSFKDTFNVDLGDIDEDDIERINYGEVTFEVLNSVPVSLSVTAAVLDSSYRTVLNLPTGYSDISSITVPKPEVSNTGEILMAESVIQTVQVINADIQKLLANPYMMIEVRFISAGDGISPVKFKTNNKISIDARVRGEYRVDL